MAPQSEIRVRTQQHHRDCGGSPRRARPDGPLLISRTRHAASSGRWETIRQFLGAALVTPYFSTRAYGDFKRRRLEELRGRDSLLEQRIVLLEREVETAYRFAYHDQLTGLPNRRLLLDRFNQVVARGIRHHEHVVLLFIDLDGFKRINDTLGHTVGDRVLQQLAARLTACIRASDTACRYGGDEFVVLLPEIQTLDQAAAVMAKISAQLAEPYAIGDSTVTSTASIGIAVFPVDGCEFLELIQAADRDMYRNKSPRSAPKMPLGFSA